ncbi:MAG: 50S ribosomal protein L9, partial [Bacillota bacterium]
LQGLTVIIRAKAGEGGRLFGSITSKDIAERVQKAAHVEIDRRKVVLADAIKTLGAHEVQIKLHPKVGAVVKVVVEPEDRAV